MEDPQDLLHEILSFARQHDGIDVVVQTGSRARDQRVDALSDLDVELIGAGAPGLSGRDDWPAEIAPVMVALQLRNDEPDAPEWPTCLVVFAQGRKVDFTLAGPGRIAELVTDGLDSTYARGYVVHYDRTGATRDLPPSRPRAPRWQAPTAAEFLSVQREFWFEATQVPIYAARNEAWPAGARLVTVREALLRMLEWRAGAASGGQTDTWYLGYHLDEWLDPESRAGIADLFPGYDVAEITVALRAAIGLFDHAVTETATLLSLPLLDLRGAVERHLSAVVG